MSFAIDKPIFISYICNVNLKQIKTMTNQEIIEKSACGLSEDIDGKFYQLYDPKKICELKDEQFRQMVKDYIELAYDEGSHAHLLEDLLKEF